MISSDILGLTWQVLAAAVVMDLIFGDPRWLPHPIIWMGRAVSFFEPRFRKRFSSPLGAGCFFALFLIVLVFVLSLAVLWIGFALHPLVGRILQAVLLFFCFSAKSLVRAAMDVAAPLMAGDLERARVMVGYIVGRETNTLDREGITRAAVETVAENFVDGFLSPLFFALVLGVPGALTYKMINTMDSMVGYKNDAYLFFGRAAAKIDDVANFIPARLSLLIIPLSTALVSLSLGKRSLSTAWSQRRNHKSPNAGYPEAAFSGALGVRMGGPNVYHGKRVEKPYIGGWFNEPGPDRISRACELMILSVLVSALVAGYLLWWFG